MSHNPEPSPVARSGARSGFLFSVSRLLPLSGRAKLVIAGLLLVHVALGIDAARKLTVTHDEYWHLPAGLLAWKTGRVDYDDLNPPLTRLWAALPLTVTSTKVDPLTPPGDLTALGDRFLEANRNSYVTWFTIARAMNLCWSLLTALLLARWAFDLFGERAAVLTVALWTLCPIVLANAAIVTPDVGTACLFTAALYACWRFARSATWAAAAAAGLLLGLAQLAKFTNVLLYPLAIVVWVLVRTDPRVTVSLEGMEAPRPPQRMPFAAGLNASLWKIVAAYALSLVVLSAGFLFDGTGSTLRHLPLQSQSLRALQSLGEFWRHVPIPLPRHYILGFDHQRQMMELPHPVFLDGQWSLTGFWDYVPRALAYKLPHAAQALLILSVVFNLVSRRERSGWRVQALLWAPVIVLVVIAGTTPMQLGVRYVLPAFPFLFLLAGQCGRWLDWPTHKLRTVLVGAAALALPLSLRFHPHHLAYFNELAGGPVGGRYHLIDSNLDWGQDLRELKRWLDEHEVQDVGLAYFGMVPPAAVGVDYHIPPRIPTPGWYAVSVNFVMGRPHTVRLPDGTLRPADVNEFARYRLFEPVARIGYSIDVYHITPEDLQKTPSPYRAN